MSLRPTRGSSAPIGAPSAPPFALKSLIVYLIRYFVSPSLKSGFATGDDAQGIVDLKC